MVFLAILAINFSFNGQWLVGGNGCSYFKDQTIIAFSILAPYKSFQPGRLNRLTNHIAARLPRGLTEPLYGLVRDGEGV